MADYTCEVDEVQYEIDRQQKRVADAYNAVRKGGSVQAYNREERKLGLLHQKKWAVSGGLVSDER
jgi:hypothetical protein